MNALKNLTQQALVHHVDRLDRSQVLLNQHVVVRLSNPDVGELERLGQALQAFNRFVVRVANLLVLVWVHLLEGVAKLGFVVVSWHSSVSGLGVVSYMAYEPYVLENIKHGSAQFSSFLVGRDIWPCDVETDNCPHYAQNKKTPKRGERRALWAKCLVVLAVGRELTSFGLLEPGVFAFGVNLPHDRAVERGVRRLAAWTGPIAFLCHRFDHLFGVEWFGRFAQDLGCCAESRQAFGNGFFFRLCLQRLRRLGGTAISCALLGGGRLTSRFLCGHESSPIGNSLLANCFAWTQMSHAFGNTSSVVAREANDFVSTLRLMKGT